MWEWFGFGIVVFTNFTSHRMNVQANDTSLTLKRYIEEKWFHFLSRNMIERPNFSVSFENTLDYMGMSPNGLNGMLIITYVRCIAKLDILGKTPKGQSYVLT